MALAVGLQRTEVCYMSDLLRPRDSAKRSIRRRLSLPLAHARLHIRGRRVASCGNCAETLALAKVQRGKLGVANVRRVFEHRFEHRLKLAWRAADDLQHLRRCRLLLKRFA